MAHLNKKLKLKVVFNPFSDLAKLRELVLVIDPRDDDDDDVTEDRSWQRVYWNTFRGIDFAEDEPKATADASALVITQADKK